VPFLIVRLLLVAFLLLLALLLIRRIMWARSGERPNNRKRADDTQRSKGQQRARRKRQETPPRDPWWKVLGVSPKASLDEIKEHYREAIRMHHPDRVAGLAPELITLAEQRTKELNAAFSEAKRVRGGAAK
jgi:DnaJ-domain-containing protein 1